MKEEVDAIAQKCVIYECGKEKGKYNGGMNRKGRYIEVVSKTDKRREFGQATIYITNEPYHKGIYIYCTVMGGQRR